MQTGQGRPGTVLERGRGRARGRPVRRAAGPAAGRGGGK